MPKSVSAKEISANIEKAPAIPGRWKTIFLILQYSVPGFLIAGQFWWFGFSWVLPSIFFTSVMVVLILLAVFVSLFLAYYLWECVHQGAFGWGKLAARPFERFSEGDIRGANRDFNAALARAKRFNANDPRRARMLWLLGSFLMNQALFDEADALFKEALEILSAKGFARVADRCKIWCDLAGSWVWRGRYADAQRELEKCRDELLVGRAKESRTLFHFNGDIQTVEYYVCQNLTAVFLCVDAKEEAEKQFEELKVIFESIPQFERAPLTNEFHTVQAILLASQGNVHAALDVLDAMKPNGILHSNDLRLAFHAMLKDYEVAASFEEGALASRSAIGPIYHPRYVGPDMYRALCALKLSRYEKAFLLLHNILDTRNQYDLPRFPKFVEWLEHWPDPLKAHEYNALARRVEEEIKLAKAAQECGITTLEQCRLRPARPFPRDLVKPV